MTEEEWRDTQEIKQDQMREYLVRNWLAIEGRSARTTDNNSEYITVVAGGQKEDGEIFPCFYTTLEGAIQAWVESVNKIGRKPDNSGLRAVVRCWPELRREAYIDSGSFFDQPASGPVFKWHHQVFEQPTSGPVFNWHYQVYSRMVFE